MILPRSKVIAWGYLFIIILTHSYAQLDGVFGAMMVVDIANDGTYYTFGFA